jgi:hypothetical protein
LSLPAQQRLEWLAGAAEECVTPAIGPVIRLAVTMPAIGSDPSFCSATAVAFEIGRIARPYNI